MEDIEKSRIPKYQEDTEDNISNKIMTTLVANTIREIVKEANRESIHREDIVSLLKENEQYVLIYFK